MPWLEEEWERLPVWWDIKKLLSPQPERRTCCSWLMEGLYSLEKMEVLTPLLAHLDSPTCLGHRMKVRYEVNSIYKVINQITVLGVWTDGFWIRKRSTGGLSKPVCCQSRCFQQLFQLQHSSSILWPNGFWHCSSPKLRQLLSNRRCRALFKCKLDPRRNGRGPPNVQRHAECLHEFSLLLPKSVLMLSIHVLRTQPTRMIQVF